MSLIKDIIVYAILGAIQGFSEPIPISSSGHLVIFKKIFENFYPNACGFKKKLYLCNAFEKQTYC